MGAVETVLWFPRSSWARSVRPQLRQLPQRQAPGRKTRGAPSISLDTISRGRREESVPVRGIPPGRPVLAVAPRTQAKPRFAPNPAPIGAPGARQMRQKLRCDDAVCHPYLPLNRSSPTSWRTATLTRSETEALGESIAALAARLHAATYELLVLLREFDANNGWGNGFLSCAHWLHWRTGIDLGAAREKVRVAKALAALPHISASMQVGQISYAKVRALTRVATAGNESTLLDFALAGTAAHVERLVRGWRRVDRQEEARETEVRHLNRQLAMWVDDDGMVVIRGRLTPEVGAVVQRAIEAAADRLFRDGAKSPAAGSVSEECHFAQRRADALGLLAEAALAAEFDRGTAGDRYQVVLHVTADEPAAPEHHAVPVDRRVTATAGDSAALRCRARGRRRRPSRFRGNVAAPRLRRLDRPDDPRRRWHRAGRRTQDAVDSAGNPPGARRARPEVPLPRLRLALVRRPPRRPLGRWRPDEPRQPAAPVPPPPPRHPRGRLRRLAGRRWWVHVRQSPTERQSRRRHPCRRRRPGSRSDLAVTSIAVWDGTPLDLAWAIDVLRPQRDVQRIAAEHDEPDRL